MTRILHTYPIIYLLLYSLFSSHTANLFSRFFSIALLRRPTGVSPTGSLAPFPFVSALFVLTCAIEEMDSADLVPEFSHFVRGFAICVLNPFLSIGNSSECMLRQ
jgi:hypothetical protein